MIYKIFYIDLSTLNSVIIMLDSIYVINGIKDMESVESRLSFLNLGEHGRCNIVRSADYQRFRLAALYKKNKTMELHKRPFRLTLENSTVCLFMDMNDGNEFYEEEMNMKRKAGKRCLYEETKEESEDITESC